MRMPVHAIRAQVIGPQPACVAVEAGHWSSDLRLFAMTYAAGFLVVSLLIA